MKLGDAFFDVVKFHRKFHQPVCEKPTPFGDRTSIRDGQEMSLRDFRKMLIKEEYEELMEALEGDDLAHIACEAIDLIYVILGTLVVLGINATRVWWLIHDCNMRKKYDKKAGKPSKPPGWVKPIVKVRAEIRDQEGWLPEDDEQHDPHEAPDMPETREEQIDQMVNELLALDEGLTTWEVGFIEDMSRRTTYTPDQEAKIEQIWQERMP